jgi:tRNA 2-selenouridine synthase
VRFAPARGTVVLAGLAGVGKTELLRELAAGGEQVLDLEALASHRGSAFGGLGLPPQPSPRQFAAAVRRALRAADPARVLWVEDEGSFIGRVGVPLDLQERMARAPAIELRASLDARVARLAATYAGIPPEQLQAAIARSATRLGPERMTASLEHLRAGDLPAAIRAVLPAYDAAYAHRAARASRRLLAVIDRDARA